MAVLERRGTLLQPSSPINARIRAIYNGPLVRVDHLAPPLNPEHRNTPNPVRILVFPRLNSAPAINGTADLSDSWGIFEVIAEDNLHVARKADITKEQILGDYAGKFNPEDARALPLPNGDIILGFTAARISDVTPFPGFLKLHVSAQDQSEVASIERLGLALDLPPGKNVSPLTDITDTSGLAIYREEGKDRQFTFIRKVEDGTWKIARRITIDPDRKIPWVGKDGKFGLTGTEPIPKFSSGAQHVDIEPGEEFLMLIHGFKYVRGKFFRRIPEYALGIAKCKQQDDRTFDVLEVSPHPILSYSDVRGEAEEYNWRKRVVYSTGYTRVGDKVFVSVTTGDTKTELYTASVENLWNHFDMKAPHSFARNLSHIPRFINDLLR